MNSFQIAYAAWLAGIFILSRPDRAAWVVLANMTATLAVCGLMDIDAMSDAGSRMDINIGGSFQAVALFQGVYGVSSDDLYEQGLLLV